MTRFSHNKAIPFQIGDRGSLETDPLVSASVSKSLGDATVERILRQHQPKAISFLQALKIPVSVLLIVLGVHKGPAIKFNIPRKRKFIAKGGGGREVKSSVALFVYSMLICFFHTFFFAIFHFEWHCQVVYCVQWNLYTMTHLNDNCEVVLFCPF